MSKQTRKNVGRGSARYASRQKREDVADAINAYDVVSPSKRSRQKSKKVRQLPKDTLRIVPLGGQDEMGAANMIIFEYEDDAIVVDTGFDLGVNLPGINYGVPDITYLKQIKDKVRAYVFTHGHMDHIGAAPHILPEVPAPVYASRFTLGMLERQLNDSEMKFDFSEKQVPMNIDNGEKLKIGPFMVELVRVTHSIPESALVSIDTPAGKVVHTGDFRLDPEPLDNKPTDIKRIKELGQEDVTMLMSESLGAERLGRTPTEHTLQPSFMEIFQNSPGRVIASTFSSQINRIQMIINAAVKTGRKVAIDGRSMLATVEMSVKMGYIKIPKGTVVPMRQANNLKDQETAIICTGSQGEENAALNRMSLDDHKYVNLRENDTIVFSSKPIPATGNDMAIREMLNRMLQFGVTVYRAEKHELDGVGPLHVSGHASRDELVEMLEMTDPKFFMPIYGDYAARHSYADLAKQNGFKSDNVVLAADGDIVEVKPDKVTQKGSVPSGTILVDRNETIVPGVVIKDRMLMAEDGMVVVILTIDKHNGQLLASPDIISRGFIYMSNNEELMGDLRTELRRYALEKGVNGDVKSFKKDLRDNVNDLLYKRTGRSPIILPVVNLIESN